MPITQDRLLRLITAGEHFRDAASTLRAAFNTKSAAIFAHTLTFEQAFSDLNLEMNVFTNTDSLASSILSEERTRYNITHKRNSIEKRRIYNRRHSINPTPSSQPRLFPSSTLAEVNSRFTGASDDTDLSDFDTPSPSDIHAAIDRAISESSSKK